MGAGHGARVAGVPADRRVRVRLKNPRKAAADATYGAKIGTLMNNPG